MFNEEFIYIYIYIIIVKKQKKIFVVGPVIMFLNKTNI